MVPGVSAAPGSRSSAPVEMTATRTRGLTRTEARPTEARAASARADRTDPASSTGAPAPRSSPAVRTFASRGGARRISTAAGRGPGPADWSVSSTLTTASAPRGSIAPVMIRWAVPGSRGRGSRPAGTSPATGRLTGCSALAPLTSWARTA